MVGRAREDCGSLRMTEMTLARRSQRDAVRRGSQSRGWNGRSEFCGVAKNKTRQGQKFPLRFAAAMVMIHPVLY